MSSRPAKKQRWQERGPSDKQVRLSQFSVFRCSESSLVKIAKVLRSQPELLEQLQNAPLAESAEAFVQHLCRQPVTLDLRDGSRFEWHIADFGLALGFYAKQSDNFRDLLRRQYAARPPSPDQPWQLILYNDEAVPGAVLRQDNRRKLVCYYISIKDFGPKVLCHEAAWFPIGFLRHHVAKQVVGGFSAIARVVLRQLLVAPHSLRVAGAIVDGIGRDGQAALIFAELGNLVYDESACNATLSTKGAGGLLPCVCCKNVHNSRDHENPLSLHDVSGTLVDISCGDPRRFDARSDDDLWFAADLLSRLHPTLTRAQFAEQERFLGVTWNPHGLLWDIELRAHCRPISVHTYDPSHCFVCSGVCQKEMSMLLCRLRAGGVMFESIRLLLGADWRACKCLGGSRAGSIFSNIFGFARERHFQKSKEFSCGASEFLDIIAPFRYFLEVQNEAFQRDFANEVASFTAMAEVMSLLSLAKDGAPVGDELARALHRHAERFAIAYGEEDGAYIPKFHFARHIPAQVARDGQVLDTLACERLPIGILFSHLLLDRQRTSTNSASQTCVRRRPPNEVPLAIKEQMRMNFRTRYHQRTKNVADPIKNTRRFEYFVLGRALQTQLSLLNAPLCFGSGLLQSVPFPDLGGDAAIAGRMIWHGTQICQDDLIRLDGRPFLIQCCLALGSEYALIAKPLHLVEKVTKAASRWQVASEAGIEELSGRSLRLCVCWTTETSGHMLIVDRA